MTFYYFLPLCRFCDGYHVVSEDCPYITPPHNPPAVSPAQIDPYTHTEFPGPYASMEDQALYFYGPNYMDVQEPRGHYIHHYHHRSPVNAHHRDYASAEGIPRGLMSWGRGRKDADTHRRDGNPGQHQGWNYESYWVWNSAQRRDGDREFLDPHRGHRRMVPRPVRHIRREIMNTACFL